MRDDARSLLAAAVQRADQDLTGPVTVPPFERLLSRLPSPAGQPARAPGRRSAPAAWRITWRLTLFQARLMPRSLGPLTAAGFALAVLMARQVTRAGGAVQLFSALITLCILMGVIVACGTHNDPRRELAAAMPVSPAVVLGARLTLILAADLSLATVASAVLASTSHAGGFTAVASGWLGRALLASSAGVLVSVWRSSLAGTATGVALWLLGWVPAPVGPVVTSTQPWTLAAAAVLLCLAIAVARWPALAPGRLDGGAVS